MRRAYGKLVMFLVIGPISTFTYVEFHESAGKMEHSMFLQDVVSAFSYEIITILADNSMVFAGIPRNMTRTSRFFLENFLNMIDINFVRRRLNLE